jgi:hypothetical protein
MRKASRIDRIILNSALAKVNIAATAVIWTAKQWTGRFWLLIFHNTWDYFEKEAEFNLWLDQIEQLGIKLSIPSP